jgi:hypothetical protein
VARVILAKQQKATAADEVDRHPAWYFILYLLVVSDDPSRDSVNLTLGSYGLAKCSDVCYQAAVATVGSFPEDFYLGSSTHKQSAQYLRKLRIFSLVHPDEAQEEMQKKILNDPGLRSKLDTLLLAKVSSREMSFRLRKSGDNVSALAVEEYRHYFWNTEVMSLEGWAAYFDADSNGRTGRLDTVSKLSSALVCGPTVAFQKVGFEQVLDRQKILDELQAELYSTFQEVRQLPLSEKKVEMLGNVSRALLRVDERQAASDTALQDVLRRFERFKVRGEGVSAPSLFDLAPTGSVSNKNREEILSSRENT